MKITREFKVRPLMTPNFILLEDGNNDCIPISEFTDEQLAALADEFKENLIKKAQKK